jgi:hypothetical protein
MKRLSYYIPGGLLIFMGLLIVAFPEILIALVSAIIIMVGVGALVIGHYMRKAEHGARGGYEWTESDDDGFCRVRIGRSPFFRRWYRRF